MHNTTFPTASECLISIVNAFDCSTHNHQELHDLNKSLDVDNRKFSQLIDEHLKSPLEKYISPEFAVLVSEFVKEFISEYMVFVGENHLFSVPREIGVRSVSFSFFAMKAARFLELVCDQCTNIKPALLVSDNKTALEATFDFLNLSDSSFFEHVSALNKEDRDKVRQWKKGLVNASLSRSIVVLFTGKKFASVRAAILAARALDFLSSQTDSNQVRHSILSFLNSKNDIQDCQAFFSELQSILYSQNDDISRITLRINFLLKITHPGHIKSNEDKNFVAHMLELMDTDPRIKTVFPEYLHHWWRARFQVFSGDLKNSNSSYKLAFKLSLYQAGRLQQAIIEEALLVAAVQPEPDKVFLKKLKIMAISLGYEIPFYPNDKIDSRKADDILENWEVDMWKNNFSKHFIKEGLFEGVSFSSNKENSVGPLMFSLDQHKPDYRYPNRLISVGDIGRKMPQINFFIMNDELEKVKKLLDNKASINVMSEVGDTPLILALTGMSVVELWQAPSRKAKLIFEKLCEKKHKPEIVNSRTEKCRRTALVCAVDTFDPNVVKKVISLNKDIEIDKPALSENMTALYRCLLHIRTIKVGDYAENFKKCMADPSPELLNTIRRMSGGINGHTITEQGIANKTIEEQEDFDKFRKVLIDRQAQDYQNLSIDKMRKIGMILLEKGANPNANHDLPGIDGYTPLIFAAEIDELILFKAMIEYGGDINQTCSNNVAPDVSCKEIASSFGSKSITELLEGLEAS